MNKPGSIRFCATVALPLSHAFLLRSVIRIVCIAWLILFSFHVAHAQQADSTVSQIGRGGQVILTNSGFGLGGFLSRALSPEWSLRLDAGVGAVKDEREVAFFDRFGRRDVPNKANYLVELPLLLGFERQVFASRIEANFRPFIALSAGPTLGWIYPYFDDENENGRLDDNEPTNDVLSGLSGGSLRTAVTVSGSFGARFGSIHQAGYGLRFGYRFTRYNRDIALLEPQIKAPGRRFVTPVVTVYFGTLRN